MAVLVKRDDPYLVTFDIDEVIRPGPQVVGKSGKFALPDKRRPELCPYRTPRELLAEIQCLVFLFHIFHFYKNARTRRGASTLLSA